MIDDDSVASDTSSACADDMFGIELRDHFDNWEWYLKGENGVMDPNVDVDGWSYHALFDTYEMRNGKEFIIPISTPCDLPIDGWRKMGDHIR